MKQPAANWSNTWIVQSLESCAPTSRGGTRKRNRWKTRLHLTATREGKLKPIAEATVNGLRSLRASDLRQTDEILARAQARIDPELTPEQHARLQKMRERASAGGRSGSTFRLRVADFRFSDWAPRIMTSAMFAERLSRS